MPSNFTKQKQSYIRWLAIFAVLLLFGLAAGCNTPAPTPDVGTAITTPTATVSPGATKEITAETEELDHSITPAPPASPAPPAPPEEDAMSSEPYLTHPTSGATDAAAVTRRLVLAIDAANNMTCDGDTYARLIPQALISLLKAETPNVEVQLIVFNRSAHLTEPIPAAPVVEVFNSNVMKETGAQGELTTITVNGQGNLIDNLFEYEENWLAAPPVETTLILFTSGSFFHSDKFNHDGGDIWYGRDDEQDHALDGLAALRSDTETSVDAEQGRPNIFVVLTCPLPQEHGKSEFFRFSDNRGWWYFVERQGYIDGLFELDGDVPALIDVLDQLLTDLRDNGFFTLGLDAPWSGWGWAGASFTATLSLPPNTRIVSPLNAVAMAPELNRQFSFWGDNHSHNLEITDNDRDYWREYQPEVLSFVDDCKEHVWTAKIANSNGADLFLYWWHAIPYYFQPVIDPATLPTVIINHQPLDLTVKVSSTNINNLSSMTFDCCYRLAYELAWNPATKAPQTWRGPSNPLKLDSDGEGGYVQNLTVDLQVLGANPPEDELVTLRVMVVDNHGFEIPGSSTPVVTLPVSYRPGVVNGSFRQESVSTDQTVYVLKTEFTDGRYYGQPDEIFEPVISFDGPSCNLLNPPMYAPMEKPKTVDRKRTLYYEWLDDGGMRITLYAQNAATMPFDSPCDTMIVTWEDLSAYECELKQDGECTLVP